MSDDPPDGTVIAMVAELDTLPPCEFTFRPESLLMVVSLLQLALRHPHLPDSHRAFIAAFLDRARIYFANCPVVLDVIARGDDPSEDVVLAPFSRRMQ